MTNSETLPSCLGQNRFFLICTNLQLTEACCQKALVTILIHMMPTSLDRAEMKYLLHLLQEVNVYRVLSKRDNVDIVL